METDSVVSSVPEPAPRELILGAEVQPEEITAFAKSSCKYCAGSGFLVRHVSPMSNGVVTKLARVRMQTICGCAGQRFIKKNRSNIIATEEGLYWRPEVKPAIRIDERPQPAPQPPVDNEHVAPGCEPFSAEVLASNARPE